MAEWRLLPRVPRDTFPDANTANEDGVVTAGAAPHVGLLIEAYQHGIFPWPHRGMPLLWFSPDPRFVLPLNEARVPRSLVKAMRTSSLRVTMDTAFAEVMTACGQQPRPGQRGTWITKPMIDGYRALHEMGLAHSVEVWQDNSLVGGLYGVSFGAVFFGESMFARVDDASKIAFATMIAQLSKWGFHVIDCQQETVHLARFGASLWPRQRFLDVLDVHVVKPTQVGPWQLSVTAADAAAWWQTRPEPTP